MRWLVPVVLLAIAAITTAIGVSVYISARQAEYAQPLVYPKSGESLWPTETAWVWSYPIPPGDLKGALVGLEIREKRESLTDANHGMFRGDLHIREADADRTLGTGMMNVPPSSEYRRVMLQLVDLSDAGLVSSKAGQNLRVFGRFVQGGGMSSLNGDQSVLPPGRFSGWGSGPPNRWENDELPLLRFTVEGADSRWNYEAVLKVHRQ